MAHRTLNLIAPVLVASVAMAQASTARVGDVTRLQGQGINVLVGYGLVAGLQGTGDGGKFLPTMQGLAAALQRFGANLESVADVEQSKNVAIVLVEAVIPEHGAREGDRLDVRLSALAAKSLAGGQLLSTPLVYHDRTVEGLFGFAQGSIVLDSAVFTRGLIRGGARLERDVYINVLTTGADLMADGFSSPWIQPDETYITLVLDDNHAGWSMAAAVAQALDKELALAADVERVALALDSKNVVALVPGHQLGDVASWIRDVERTPILLESNEARVTVNRTTRTIVVTGDTRMSPVIVSQGGLTVTIEPPELEGAAARPRAETQVFVPVDVERTRSPHVRDLLDALNRLKVPFEERVSILEEIHRAGKLHARLMYEG